jgi:hypothetical protein
VSPAIWTEVDRYIADSLVPSDAGLDAVLKANAPGLPPHEALAAGDQRSSGRVS